ncbi:MAG: glycosyltransferase family 4 protein [archaeon]|jgi:glycosyltransferase involved in cell wall biosynthesis|nr:glycosyltransferase family 4 protein [archaeon]
MNSEKMIKKKPKVCFITAFFYPTIGGVEAHIENVGKELIKLGYDVEVFTSDMDRDKRIKEKTGNLNGIGIRRFKSWIKLTFAEMFFPGLFSAVKKSNADIFHVHGYRHLFNFAFLFSKKPFFLTPHWPIYRGLRGAINQFVVDCADFFLGRYIFRHFKKVCVVTDLETPWVESFGVPRGKIMLTPNCIPDNYFRAYDGKKFRKKYGLKNNETVVLSLSRIHKTKGVDQMVRVAQFFPRVKFVVLGKDGGARNELIELARSLKLNNVIIGGEVNEKEKMEAFAGSDIYTLPSHYEAFGISILEAMSQGCAVITSNKGGMPWVVKGAGLTFKDYDLKDYREKLERLINDRKLRNSLEKAGKLKAKKFVWKNVALALDKEYKKLIKP